MHFIDFKYSTNIRNISSFEKQSSQLYSHSDTEQFHSSHAALRPYFGVTYAEDAQLTIQIYISNPFPPEPHLHLAVVDVLVKLADRLNELAHALGMPHRWQLHPLARHRGTRLVRLFFAVEVVQDLP